MSIELLAGPVRRKATPPPTTVGTVEALAAQLAALERQEGAVQADLGALRQQIAQAAAAHDEAALHAAWQQEAAAAAQLDQHTAERARIEGELRDLLSVAAKAHARAEQQRLLAAGAAQRDATADLRDALAATLRAFDALPTSTPEAQPYPADLTALATRLSVPLPDLPPPPTAPALPALDGALLALLPAAVRAQGPWMARLTPHERRLLCAAAFALSRLPSGEQPGGTGAIEQRRARVGRNGPWVSACALAAQLSGLGADAISDTAATLFFGALEGR